MQNEPVTKLGDERPMVGHQKMMQMHEEEGYHMVLCIMEIQMPPPQKKEGLNKASLQWGMMVVNNPLRRAFLFLGHNPSISMNISK